MNFKLLSLLLNLTLLVLLLSTTTGAQTTAFTYQGKLTDAGSPANGQYDFQFKLFDTASIGTGVQQGGNITSLSVQVTAGTFTVQLDFGACPSCFNGSPRFLEIAVKPTGGASFTTLNPRQPIDASPYAIRTLAATTADGLSVACVNCISSGQIQSIQGTQVTGNIAGSQINGAIPVASVPAGSASYVQNTNSPQPSTNFNISGNGTASGTISGNIVNATLQYSLGGNTILSNPGTNNLFAGIGSGQANTNGGNNAFFGHHAGQSNVFGTDNTFAGFSAGLNNTGGILGGGRNNTFVGSGAGQANTTAEGNSFFGQGAGQTNTTGNFNSFFGRIAGNNSGTGRLNTFVGAIADFTTPNATGDKNTLLGASTQITSGLTNATAIGSQAMVTQSNSLVLGQINGVNGSTVDTNVGIGTTAPAARLHVVGDSFFNGFVGINTATPQTSLDVNGALMAFDVTAGNIVVPERGNGVLQLVQDSYPQHFTGFRPFVRSTGPELRFSVDNLDSAFMDSGGVLHQQSSRLVKERFRELDLDDMLARIERLPVMEWSYKGQDASIRHIGPFAEDFHALFGLDGGNDKMISTVDPSGVALVGVKALAEQLRMQDREIAELKSENASLNAHLRAIEKRLRRVPRTRHRKQPKTGSGLRV